MVLLYTHLSEKLFSFPMRSQWKTKGVDAGLGRWAKGSHISGNALGRKGQDILDRLFPHPSTKQA